ncbi:hypothetical protein JCM8208_005244 [Rhodotorula glutinis]
MLPPRRRVKHRAAARPDRPALPDELVLNILERVAAPEPDETPRTHKLRRQTLVALCRLAKRFVADVKRKLYVRVTLRLVLSRNVERGSVQFVLAREPYLRKVVKAVHLAGNPAAVDDPSVRELLGGLVNVEDMSVGDLGVAAIEVLRAMPARQLCRLQAPTGYQVVKLLDMRRARAILSGVTHLSLTYDVAGLSPALVYLPSLQTLVVCGTTFVGPGLEQLAESTNAVRQQLVSIRVPIRAFGWWAYNLSIYDNLTHFTLGIDAVTAQSLDEVIPRIVRSLESLARSANLQSLTLEGCVESWRDRTPDGRRTGRLLATQDDIPRSTNDILLAVPPQIRSLSLLTPCLRTDDVARYLLGPSRPPHLDTLRAGDRLGRSLRKMLDGGVGPFRALARELERAGITVRFVE